MQTILFITKKKVKQINTITPRADVAVANATITHYFSYFIHDYYYFTCILAFLSKCANVTLDLCHFLCFIASLIITVAIFLLIRMINMVEILHFKSEVRCADGKVVYDLLYCV